MGRGAGDGGRERGRMIGTTMNYDRARTKLFKWIRYDYSRTALLKASLLLSVVTIMIATLFLSFLVIVLPSSVNLFAIIVLVLGFVMMFIIVTPLRQISRLLAWGTLLAINAITVLLVNWCSSIACGQLTALESLPEYFARHCQPKAINDAITGIILGFFVFFLVVLVSGIWKLKDLYQD